MKQSKEQQISRRTTLEFHFLMKAIDNLNTPHKQTLASTNLAH